jgi:hypothetical protein
MISGYILLDWKIMLQRYNNFLNQQEKRQQKRFFAHSPAKIQLLLHFAAPTA